MVDLCLSYKPSRKEGNVCYLDVLAMPRVDCSSLSSEVTAAHPPDMETDRSSSVYLRVAGACAAGKYCIVLMRWLGVGHAGRTGSTHILKERIGLAAMNAWAKEAIEMSA
jgi:hypothetical protein